MSTNIDPSPLSEWNNGIVENRGIVSKANTGAEKCTNIVNGVNHSGHELLVVHKNNHVKDNGVDTNENKYVKD